ncbi:MAG: hypothetical protein GTN79_13875 [Gammaproteobacteria bacterium]|nr:hypothetical protein [Gammaproteobacteria bacterium]NIR20752.1 hypothetical protein [Gammaproteobacteria bacterium]
MLSRPVIVTLAVIGAVIATIGSFLLRKGSRVPARTARVVLRVGYGFAWLSVGLFIAAGFRGG